MRKINEKGSASIEAACSLVIFMLFFISVYMVVSFTIVQERISVSLNSAARQMSQYSYFYELFGLGAIDDKLSDKKQDVIGLYEQLTAKGEGNIVVAGVEINPGNVQEVGEKFMENPKQYLVSLASLGAEAGADSLKSALASACAEGIVLNNIAGSKDASLAWLERNGVSELDFSKSKMLQSDARDEIDLMVSYKLDISKLIPIRITLNCAARAHTYAWLGGDDSWKSGS